MISVCIATYNGALFIKEQLNSMLSQLQADDEIIISDDGSTDATLSIIQRYHDSRIRVIHHSRNTPINPHSVWDRMACVRKNFEEALKQAKGDVIFLADQDDVWMPDKVEKVLANMSDKAFCVVHDCKVVDGDLQTINESMFSSYRPCFNRLGWLWKSPFMGCCMVVRKEVLTKALPIPDCVEYDTWLGVISSAMGEVQILKQPLILYRRHGKNISTCSQKSENPLLTKLQRRYFLIKNLIKKI